MTEITGYGPPPAEISRAWDDTRARCKLRFAAVFAALDAEIETANARATSAKAALEQARAALPAGKERELRTYHSAAFAARDEARKVASAASDEARVWTGARHAIEGARGEVETATFVLICQERGISIPPAADQGSLLSIVEVARRSSDWPRGRTPAVVAAIRGVEDVRVGADAVSFRVIERADLAAKDLA
jgi:hypothetical protein